jgi:hypothetical protein
MFVKFISLDRFLFLQKGTREFPLHNIVTICKRYNLQLLITLFKQIFYFIYILNILS